MAGFSHAMNSNDSALFYAARLCRPEAMRHCIEKGAQRRILDADGQSPLHAIARGACQASDEDLNQCVKELLSHGYSIGGDSPGKIPHPMRH